MLLQNSYHGLWKPFCVPRRLQPALSSTDEPGPSPSTGMPKKSTDDLVQAAADAAGSGAPSNVPLYMPNEEHPADTPIWRKEYSYRGGPYRCVQNVPL
jgi:hypothetical protein